MNAQISHRVLISLGTAAANEASRQSVMRHGHEVLICPDATQLCAEITQGAGAILVAQDILSDDFLGALSDCLKAQPSWSHLPIVILLNEGEIADSGILMHLEELGNVTLLEPPVRVGTLMTTIRSVLAYRRKQYDVRQLMIELETSRHEAVEANRAKSDFLANMSHEIRTPLGAILGFAELLMDAGVSDREKLVYMTAVKRNGQLLSALIDDILDLAKVESGRIEIAKIEFSLSELFSDLVSSLQPQAAKKGLPMVLEKAEESLDLIVADPVRIKQILINIVGNAIKFTSHGSVTVRVKASELEDKKAELKIEVEDTGIGISASQASRLFKPFTQADTSSTRRFGGTGLGLVLSQKMARAMGGDLGLDWSIPGGGSQFAIQLPVQVVHKTGEQSLADTPGKALNLPLEGADILLVDDSLDNQMLISRILRLLGAKVEVASDGIQAVEMALKHEYDVVLMDLQMPRLGGVEATRILRDKGFKQPIIALTAHALKEDRQRCISVGCTDYLTKPIQRSLLVQVIERVSRPASMRPVH